MVIDLYDGWTGILRVIVTGTLAYAGLLVVLRATGKRTLSRLNAFDPVVTVALGSALAATMLDRATPLAEGLTGLTLLVLLQFAVTWPSVRSDRLQDIVKARPQILVHKGNFARTAMRRERVTREEIMAALREQGQAAVDEGTTVVIETDGSLSALSHAPGAGDRSTLAGLGRTAAQDDPA